MKVSFCLRSFVALHKTITADLLAGLSRGAVLGVDWGERMFGLALAPVYHEHPTILPLKDYRRTIWKKDQIYFDDCIQQYRVALVVIGWPLEENDQPNRTSQRVYDFSHMWAKHLMARGLDVVLCPEFLSSQAAQWSFQDFQMYEQGCRGRRPPSSAKVATQHSQAAVCVLQSFFDRLRGCQIKEVL